MLAVKVSIITFISTDQPGWVECKLIDAFGHEWTFHEKVPVVSISEIDENSMYPQQGVIACKIISNHRDKDERHILTISTLEPWDVETIDGNTSFEVLSEQLTEI